MRRTLATSAVLLALLVGGARADDRPAVIVTDPEAEAYRAAVQRFAQSATFADPARPQRLREEITAALDFSSVFVPLDPRAFLGPDQTEALDGGAPIDCSDWRQSGADALLEGEIRSGAGEFLVEFRAWDVARCRKLLRKRFRGADADERRIARRIADDVVEAFTGRRGVSSTEIAFVSNRSGTPEIYVMDADGSNVRAATNNRSINAFPAWSPDGRSLVYMSYRHHRSPHLFRVVRGPGGGGLLFPALNSRGAQYRAVYDPSGERLAVVLSIDGVPEIFSMPANGGKPRRLTRNRSVDLAPSWSPDGRQLAFVSDRAGAPQVYVMDADGGNVRRLTFDGSYNTAPAWSPDGRWIAYETRVRGQFDLWLIDPAGGINVPLVTHPRSDESPSWAPDGRKLVFHSTRRGRADLYVIDVDGRNLRRLTEGKGNNTSPAWGPYPR